MPRASRKQKMTTEKTTPSGWSGPGRLTRRPDSPMKVAIKGRIRKGR